MSGNNNAEEKVTFYINRVLRWRWAVLILTIFMAVVISSGLKNLSYSIDYRAFFSDDYPQLISFEALQKIYTKNDNILIVLASRDGDVFTPANLDAVENLVRRAWKIPYTIRVDAIRSEEHTSELQSHSFISYAVFCLKKKNHKPDRKSTTLNSSQ